MANVITKSFVSKRLYDLSVMVADAISDATERYNALASATDPQSVTVRNHTGVEMDVLSDFKDPIHGNHVALKVRGHRAATRRHANGGT